MKKYIKCVKLERGAGRMNGSTVFVEVPPTSKPGPLFRRVVSEERLAALNLSSKFIRTLNLPDLSADQKPSLELLNDLDTDPLKDVQPYGRSSLQDILVARRQYLRLLVAKNKKWKAVGDVLKPKTAQPCPASDLQQLRPVTRSMTNSLKRTSAGRPTTVSILGSTRATSTATITPQRCTRPSDKPYGEPLLQRIPLLAVSGSSVAAQSSSVAGQSRRPIMLSVTGKHTTPVTICQRKRPFVNINGVANSTGGGGIGIGGGGGSGLVPTDAVVASVASSTASAQTLSRKDRIPRPPNAFMLFANEYRKKLSSENPRESNKDISVRLGSMWKVMPKEKKDRYFDLARRVDEEHKRKYPHYVYNPKEARLRKAMRDQIRFRTQSSRAAVASGCAGGGGGIGGGGGRPGGGGGGSAAQPTAPPPPPQQAQHKSIASPQLQSAKLKKGFGSPRQEEINFGVAHRLAEQQRSLQTQQAIRDQVESGLLNSYDEAFVELGTTNTNGYQSVGDLTAWYPLQMQAHDNGLRGWQVTPGQFGSEQGDCITPSPQVSPYGQRLPHMISDAAQQQQLMQKPKSEPYVNLYPGSSGGYPDHIKENNMLPEDHAESQEAALVPTNGPTLENGPPLENGTSSALEDGTCSASIGTPTKLPGFQQAFGSTEIGRFSHEGFFSSQALELQVQTTPHGLPHSLHPNPSRRGISCPIPSAIPVSVSSAPSTSGVNLSEGQTPKMFGARDGLLGSPDWAPLLFLAAGPGGPGGPGDHPLHHHHPSLLAGHYPERHSAPPPSMYSGGFGSPTFSPYGYYDYNLLNPVELMSFTRGQTSSLANDPNPSTGTGAASGSGCGPGSTPTHYTDLTELQPATPADYVLYSDRATDLTHLQPPPISKQLQAQDSSRSSSGVASGTHMGSPSRGHDHRGSPNNVKMEHSADDQANDQNGGPGDPDNAILRRMVLAEPIIISENERICVVLESNSTMGGSTDQFTNL